MMRLLRCLLLCLGLAALCGRASAADWWAGLGVHDLNGSALTVKGRWVVVVFLSPECPIANAEVPELNAIAEAYAPKGVTLVGAYADPTLPLASFRQHAADYRLRFETADDRTHHLTRAAGATYTPEVCVFSRAGGILYRGRIDDRASEYGGTKPQATEQDLREVLDALTAGHPAPFAQKPGFGCSIPDLARP
ncbi:MAG TPA: redoxin domain-containing protein [Candidatus Didemnitutus sp.]|jgi:thiol-disulfide isomerase/thioredoxin